MSLRCQPQLANSSGLPTPTLFCLSLCAPQTLRWRHPADCAECAALGLRLQLRFGVALAAESQPQFEAVFEPHGQAYGGPLEEEALARWLHRCTRPLQPCGDLALPGRFEFRVPSAADVAALHAGLSCRAYFCVRESPEEVLAAAHDPAGERVALTRDAELEDFVRSRAFPAHQRLDRHSLAAVADTGLPVVVHFPGPSAALESAARADGRGFYAGYLDDGDFVQSAGGDPRAPQMIGVRQLRGKPPKVVLLPADAGVQQVLEALQNRPGALAGSDLVTGLRQLGLLDWLDGLRTAQVVGAALATGLLLGCCFGCGCVCLLESCSKLRGRAHAKDE